MSKVTSVIGLIPYRRYRVRYKCPDGGVHRVPREMVALFIGLKNEAKVLGETEAIFSGRPVFGTANVPETWFIQAQETVDPPHGEVRVHD